MASSNNDNDDSDLQQFLNDEEMEPNGQYAEIQRVLNLIIEETMTPTAYTNITAARLHDTIVTPLIAILRETQDLIGPALIAYSERVIHQQGGSNQCTDQLIRTIWHAIQTYLRGVANEVVVNTGQAGNVEGGGSDDGDNDDDDGGDGGGGGENSCANKKRKKKKRAKGSCKKPAHDDGHKHDDGGEQGSSGGGNDGVRPV